MISINNPDKILEDDGVWTEFEDSRFKIASSTNLRFQKMFARLQMPYHKKIEKGSLDPKISLRIMCEAMGKTIVLDWEKVIDESGEEVGYSPELAQQTLINNSDLRTYVSDFSSDIDNFKSVDREALGKS